MTYTSQKYSCITLLLFFAVLLPVSAPGCRPSAQVPDPAQRITNLKMQDSTPGRDQNLPTLEPKFYSTAEKLANSPTIPVFYPWPDNCSGDLWFDCDQPETPYSLIWTSSGIVPEIDSLETAVEPEQKQMMRSDPDTIYLINEEWHYWNLNWRSLAPDSKFYLDEFFQFHIGSEYGATRMINFQHPDWPEFLAEKAANFQAEGFDGIMLDWWHDAAGNGRSQDEVQQARLEIARAIRDRTGEDFILMGNVGWEINDPTAQYLSGVFLELWRPDPGSGYTIYSEDESTDNWSPSLERMEDLLQYWDAHLAEPRLIAFEPWKITRNDFQRDRLSEENVKLARLFSAMAVVIPERGYILYADHNHDWEGGDHQHTYYQHYKTNFGSAVSRKIAVEPGAVYKEFENGLIAYNRNPYPVVFLHPKLGDVTLAPLSGSFLDYPH